MLKIFFWNSQALFGSIHGNHSRQKRKKATIHMLVQKHDVAMFCETHGCHEDALTMKLDSPHHRIFSSFSASSIAAGVVITIAESF